MQNTFKRFFAFLAFILIATLLKANNINAQEIPSCQDRNFVTEYPRVDSRFWCIEHFLFNSEMPELAYSSLVYGNDEILYASHPGLGQVVSLTDTDNDGFPDMETVIVEGIQYPNGLSFYNGDLYILATQTIYRYNASGLSPVIQDLPTGSGFIPRAFLVDNERIFVGIPYPCNSCEADTNLYGRILSFSLYGTDPQLIAEGLRYPTAIEIFDNYLWITDIAQDELPQASFFDEINRISLTDTHIPHFGFPNCIGANNMQAYDNNFNCSQTITPHIILETGSAPLSLTPYTEEQFPWLRGKLLITLGGSFDNSLIHGYALIAIDDDNYDILLPSDPAIARTDLRPFSEGISTRGASEVVNQRGAGIWPHRIYDTVVSHRGFIIFSIAGKGLYALTPSPYTNMICEQVIRAC